MPLTTDNYNDNNKVKQQQFDFETVYIHFRAVKIVFWDDGQKKLVWSPALDAP